MTSTVYSVLPASTVVQTTTLMQTTQLPGQTMTQVYTTVRTVRQIKGDGGSKSQMSSFSLADVSPSDRELIVSWAIVHKWESEDFGDMLTFHPKYFLNQRNVLTHPLRYSRIRLRCLPRLRRRTWRTLLSQHSRRQRLLLSGKRFHVPKLKI